MTVARDNRNICLMFNDVNKRGNGKEAAAGESLSAHSSRLLLYVSTYESEIRESGGNVGLIMSVQSFSFVCVCVTVGCISACPPAHEGLISLCPCGHRLHLGLHRGRPRAEVWRAIPRLCAGRTARRPLLSAGEEEDTVTQQKRTPDADTRRWEQRRLKRASEHETFQTVKNPHHNLILWGRRHTAVIKVIPLPISFILTVSRVCSDGRVELTHGCFIIQQIKIVDWI